MKKLHCVMVFLVMFVGGVSYGEIPYDTNSGKNFEENGTRWIRFDCDGGCVLNCYSDIAGDINVPTFLGGKRVLGFVPSVFRHCQLVTSIVIPEGVIDIPERAFYETSITSISLPGSIRRIGDLAFGGCTNLQKVVVQEGAFEIGSQCFSGCSRLESIELPSSITNIGAYAFGSCSNLARIAIPSGLTEISDNCFQGCKSLSEVLLPETVLNVRGGSFSGCERLGEVVFSRSLVLLEDGALTDCCRLTNVTFRSDAPSHGYNVFNSSSRDLVVYVPVGSKGWDGNPESTALPKYWPYNTEGGRRIVHIGETVDDGPSVVTNYIYSTVTNYVFSTITNEVFHYSTVTNEIFHYTTVTNVVKYVPEPGASPDAGYGINIGAGGETVIAGAAGWDAFGVPDGMEWNKETGTLSGRAKLSGAYDLILVSGSGADTKIMRTTLTVAPYDTIIGYVGVAFSQSGAPLDNLKSYKPRPPYRVGCRACRRRRRRWILKRRMANR